MSMMEPNSTTETPEEKTARLVQERLDAKDAVDLATKQRDARKTVDALLSDYGLSDLSDFIYKNIIVAGTVNINNPDAVIYAVREQPAYKTRFAGNEKRVKNGFEELSPAEYIDMEISYRNTLSANGMPSDFYDSQDDFKAMIEGAVSPIELQSRIQDGYRAVKDADPEVKRQMQQLYGVTEGELAAYFIDPTRVRDKMVAADYKRQADAAKIAARASDLAGMQLSKSFAEDLASRGVGDIAAETFTKVGKLGELTTAMAGETGLTAEQIVGSQAGTDTQAALELERRRRSRVGEFQGGGSFARTQGESAGAITTSVGTAQQGT